MRMLYWLLPLLALTSLPSGVQAAEPLPELRTYHSLLTQTGEHRFEIVRTRNEAGAWQLAVVHEELRRGLPNTQAEVLWARDINSDGFVDVWFFLGEDGQVEFVDRPARTRHGWDVAAQLLGDRVRLENRLALGIYFGSITRTLTLVRSHEFELKADLTRIQMDLLELQARADRMERELKAMGAMPALHPEYRALLGVIGEGWSEVLTIISQEGYKKHFLMAAGDVALYVTGAAAFKLLGKGFKFVGAKFLGTQAGAALRKAYLSQVAAVALRVAVLTSKPGAGTVVDSAGSAAVRVGVAAAWRATVREKVSLTLQALESRGKLGKFFAEASRTTGGVLIDAARQTPYVAVSQSTQLMAEAWNRRAVLFDSNPIVFANNIVSDEDLIQNLTFMTAETFLMAGVSTHYSDLGKRMKICAAIALVNSSASSLLVKRETDPLRMGIDSGWEMLVGNSQVQLDMAAMRYFSSLAARHRNPKLKLVAYAISFVDGLAGYVSYGKVTQKYEERKDSRENSETSGGPVMVVAPVYAP